MAKKTIPAAKPREPLTKKRRAAIHTYVSSQGEKHGYMAYYMIELVLKAERLPAAELYERLERKGYRWDSRGGYWRTLKV